MTPSSPARPPSLCILMGQTNRVHVPSQAQAGKQAPWCTRHPRRRRPAQTTLHQAVGRAIRRRSNERPGGRKARATRRLIQPGLAVRVRVSVVMCKVVSARRADTVATTAFTAAFTASVSSLPVVLAARTVSTTASPVHSSKVRRCTRRSQGDPTQCLSRASPRRRSLIHPSSHAPNVWHGSPTRWVPFARCRRRKGGCVRAARASTSRSSACYETCTLRFSK
jgi:hypothetical protein